MQLNENKQTKNVCCSNISMCYEVHMETGEIANVYECHEAVKSGCVTEDVKQRHLVLASEAEM
jgi:hypothetical protein